MNIPLEKYAVHVGFQPGIDELPGFDVFNIFWEGHPKNHSTVDLNEIKRLGIDVIFTQKGDYYLEKVPC